MLALTRGRFLSMTDHPEWAAGAVAGCGNEGTWPGLVGNVGDGVLVEVEGPAAALAAFGDRLTHRAPPLARVDEVITASMDPLGGTDFVIVASGSSSPGGTGSGRTLVSPDVATCDACRTTARPPRWRRSRSARSAPPSTPTRPTAVSTPRPWPAAAAGRP